MPAADSVAFVRCEVPEDRLEDFWIAVASFDLAGSDQGSLPGGVEEFLLYFARESEARACAAALASAFNATLAHEPVRDWNESWQAGWEPRAIGERFWIAPPHSAVAPPPGRHLLHYHPGTAFGNGDHPTTQLCLELMERLVRPGDLVLDLGCGSGLLCEAAAALGARAIGCDLDRAAADQARRRGIAVYQGSIDAVAAAHVIVANLALGTLEQLGPDLRRAARRALIVSGVLAEQRQALSEFPLVLERDGWLAGAVTFS